MNNNFLNREHETLLLFVSLSIFIKHNTSYVYRDLCFRLGCSPILCKPEYNRISFGGILVDFFLKKKKNLA